MKLSIQARFDILLLTGLFLINQSCKKETVPSLTTIEVTNIKGTTATSGGTITDEGSGTVTERGVCWSTSDSPTTADNKTSDGAGAGTFTSSLTALNEDTEYFVRAYAINSAGTGYGMEISFKTRIGISDIDGNFYETDTIGTQVWMKENLKTTRYNDDTSIPEITDNSEWIGLSSGAYCWYNNDAATNKNVYGALYNWYAVNSGKICPSGWHVPSDDEWKALEIFMGMTKDEADKTSDWRGTDQGIQIKSETGWSGLYPMGTNTVGFGALPAGFRTFVIGDFWGLGEETTYWTTSFEENTNYAWFRNLVSEIDLAYSRIYRGTTVKTYGFSVRCLQDN